MTEHNPLSRPKTDPFCSFYRLVPVYVEHYIDCLTSSAVSKNLLQYSIRQLVKYQLLWHPQWFFRTETMSVVAMSFSLCLPIFGLTTKFRADNWIDEKKRELLGNTRLLVTSEGQCFQMIQGEVKEV